MSLLQTGTEGSHTQGWPKPSCQVKFRQEQKPHSPEAWTCVHAQEQSTQRAGQEGITEKNRVSNTSALLVSIILPIIPTPYNGAHSEPPQAETAPTPTCIHQHSPSQPGKSLPPAPHAAPRQGSCPLSAGLPTLQVPLVCHSHPPPLPGSAPLPPALL